MTQFTQKSFTVKTGQRTERDCEAKGHWPRLSRTGYECTFCGTRCTVDGKSVDVDRAIAEARAILVAESAPKHRHA